IVAKVPSGGLWSKAAMRICVGSPRFGATRKSTPGISAVITRRQRSGFSYVRKRARAISRSPPTACAVPSMMLGSALLRLVLRLELECRRVDAVAKAGRLGAVVEDVAEMAVAR